MSKDKMYFFVVKMPDVWDVNILYLDRKPVQARRFVKNAQIRGRNIGKNMYCKKERDDAKLVINRIRVTQSEPE